MLLPLRIVFAALLGVSAAIPVRVEWLPAGGGGGGGYGESRCRVCNTKM